MWKRFDRKKPKKNGWYTCTVEVPNQQRYVMDLFWYNQTQQFRDNRRQDVYDVYEVYNYDGKKMHADKLCNRTNNVIAWKKRPRVYMKGFIKSDII